ncbi:hypothetical protein ACFW53_20415 [Nocardiopsis dassonvillei]|uniref:hypothetical protein n=1 Tax=Nocardiopsis dassonvillei TaxID=2014 RepID=UPI00366A86AF
MGNSTHGQLDLFGDPAPAPPLPPTRGRRGVVGEADWRQWLDDPATRQRYRAKVHQRGTGRCAPWTGTLSSTGHGKFRVGSRTDGTRRMVSAHLYGYQLEYGVITADPSQDLVLAHTCDEPACQQPRHLHLVTRQENLTQYRERRESGPLLDARGAFGRAVAVRTAILDALARGEDMEEAIAAARAAGLPSPGERLF